MIFYFSGTGNTRWAAMQIAEIIGEELFYIPDLIRKEQYDFTLKNEERIGFCFPTHGWQPPRIVREFIRRLSVSEGESAYCWALTTCGDNMGAAMTILNRELAKVKVTGSKGEMPLQAESLFSVIMPESYVCLPFMKTDSEEKEAAKINMAGCQLHRIATLVKERRRGIIELEQGATPRLYSYVIGGYFNKRMITDKKFIVDENACIRCGRCAKVCPVDNIKGTPPSWLHNGKCTTCLACYHYCPVHAINYGNITRKRGQYYFNRRADQK